VQGLGCRVQGLGCRVKGSGIRVHLFEGRAEVIDKADAGSPENLPGLGFRV
jgi:hypothetical protein